MKWVRAWCSLRVRVHADHSSHMPITLLRVRLVIGRRGYDLNRTTVTPGITSVWSMLQSPTIDVGFSPPIAASGNQGTTVHRMMG